MITNYIKIAFRNLIKQQGYAAINIGGLAVGMAVAMLIGLWVYDELSFDRQYPHYGRIAQVMQNQTFNDEVQTWGNVPLPLGPELKNNYGSNFSVVVRSGWIGDHELSVAGSKIKEKGNYMEPGVTEMLSLKMIRGSRAGLNDLNSILLSESASKALFGDAEAVNKIIQLDKKLDVKVTGIYSDLPENSSFADLHFIAPWDLMVKSQGLEKILKNPWGASWFQTYALIAENTDMATVSKNIKPAKSNAVPADARKNKPEIFLHPMGDWHLYSEFKNGVNAGGNIEFVWLFGTIGIFVLLLACINFMNLNTARSEKRAKEIGVRKAIGSLRGQLVSQFLSESFLVAAIASVVAVLLVQLSLDWFNDVAGKQIEILWTNPVFWLAIIGFAALTGTLAGSYPAWYLSSFQPVKVLKGRVNVGRFAALPRKALVVIQFTVSVTLIIGTITVFRQIQFARNRPIGYQSGGLVTMGMGGVQGHFQAFRDELKKTGKVEEAAASETEITNTYVTNSGLDWKGKAPSMQEEFVTNGVSYEFGKTIGWKIVAGRDFSRDFASDSLGIVINEAAARYLGFQDPVGETVKWGNETVHIIGVVRNMVTQNPYEPIKQTFFYLGKNYLNNIIIKINPNASGTAAVAAIGSVFKKYSPGNDFQYRFVDESYATKFEREMRIGTLATCFSVLAIFISALGLLGLASFMAEQRTKEIGIRKVLGASIANLWQLLSKDFIVLVIISCIAAAPIAAYLMSSWLEKYEYRTEISWWIFAAAAAGALLVTFVTVSFQAIKAALVNPVKSLRSE